MPDSHRPDGSRADDVASEASRDEKIEQLLLTGLDHYFAARYEQAVNVWTRALFLDKNHPRARAYIERARRALAERQRESEELFQRGLAAFNRGDSEEAKGLLLAAINRGASADDAQPLLDRLNRIRESSVPGVLAGEHRPMHASAAPREGSQSAGVQTKSSRGLVLTMIGSLVVAATIGIYSFVVRDRVGWPALLIWQEAPASAVGLPSSRDSAPPVPRRGEIALGRARSFTADGRLQEALTALDMVRATDPEKAEADSIRAEIQQRLLAAPVNTRAGTQNRQGGRQP